MKNTVQIQNLKCGGCANTIKTKLNTINDISNIIVNVEKNEVSFNSVSEDGKDKAYVQLKELGYPIINESNSLGLKAKSYVSCAIGRFQKK